MASHFDTIPTHDEFADVPAEHQILLKAIFQIAEMDTRCGGRMNEIANETVRQILEARIDAKIDAQLDQEALQS